MTESARPLDLITMGPTGVDLRPLPSGASLAPVGPFGTHLHEALKEFGADDRRDAPAARPTPVTCCELFPPADFPLYFYRQPKAPDLEIHTEEPDFFAIRATRVVRITGTGPGEEPGRSAPPAARAARGRAGSGCRPPSTSRRTCSWSARGRTGSSWAR